MLYTKWYNFVNPDMYQYPHEGNTSTRRKGVPAGNGGAYWMRGTVLSGMGGTETVAVT